MASHPLDRAGSAVVSDPDFPPLYEELKERRRRRRLIGGPLLAGVLLVGLYVAAHPAVHAVKAWQSRRLARAAEALIGRGQWRSATDKARDAYQLCLTEPEPWRAIGQLLTHTGQQAAALPWWRKLDDVHRLNVGDRRDYAGDALFANALPEAATQIGALLARGGPLDPGDALLAAQLAARQGDSDHAAAYARQALADKRSQPNQQIAAALQLLAVTPRDSPDYSAAWARLLRLARDPANPMSLDALNLLADPQLLAPLGAKPLFATTPDATVAPDRLTPDEIASALDAHPRARPQDHLRAWELRVLADPAHADELLARAGQRFGHGDDGILAGLARFLNGQGHAATTLQLLPRERAEQTPELSLAYLDALAALGRWTDVRDALVEGRLQLDPMTQHIYLAVARAKADEPEGAAVEWQRARGAAGKDGGKLFALAAYAEKTGALAVADQGYADAIEAAPDQPAAYTARVRLALLRGQTALARVVLTEFARRWPGDAEANASRAYLDLLLGGTGADARRDEQAAAPLAIRQPANWSARATLALARLHEHEATTAMAAFSGDRGTMNPQAQPDETVPPGAQAVWAATLAANGWHAEAAAAARRLADVSLLPEERALIASLSSSAATP